MRIYPARDLKHAVDRRLVAPGELRHHHVGEAAITPEDRWRASLLGNTHKLAQFGHSAAAGQRVGWYRRRRHSLRPRQVTLWQPDSDLDRIAAFTTMRIADRNAPEQRLQRIVDVALLDAEEFEPVLIDGYAQTRPPLANRVIDVDDEGTEAKIFLHFSRDSPTCFRVWSVDLGQERRKNRRARRHFDDLHARSSRERHVLQALTQIECHLRGWRANALRVAQD